MVTNEASSLRLVTLTLAFLLVASIAHVVPDMSSAQSSSIIINEVESNPPGNDNYLAVIEQVELFNPTSNPIDIGGWTINAMGGTSQESITIDSGTVISPGGNFIVGRGAQWLDNAMETVVLRNANGDQIASAGPFDDDANDSRSWQRYPNGGDSWAFRTSTIGTSNGAPAPQNVSPTANAGPDQQVNEGKSLTLDGSASSDSDGSITSYSWTQTAGPTVVGLTGASSLSPTFIAPMISSDTTVTFKLTVTDNSGATGEDTVNIAVKNVNAAPTANAGPDQQVNEGNIVTLDGSGSADPDGTIVTYAWSQTSGPSVTLSSMSMQKPSFNAPTVSTDTTLTFRLVVTDNLGMTSSTDSIAITIKDVASESVQQTSELSLEATSGEPQQSSDVTAALYPIAITNLQVNDNSAGQLTLSTTFSNKDINSVPFTALIEAREIDGVTISLQLVKGTLYAGQSLELGTLWNPPKNGPFEIRSFALSDLESPQILSPVISKVIMINESSLAEPLPSNIEMGQNEKLCAGSAKCIDGVVTRIVDGDTLDVGDIRIRLSLVDTPESYEEGYDEAKSFTSTLCPVDSHVIIDQDDRQLQDRYGRMLAKVTCGEKKVLNAELLYNGHAVISAIYCATSEFSGEDWAQDYGCAGSVPTADGTQCDASYPTVCIPSPPPDLDCDEIPYRSFKVLLPDPHRFDSDGDGIGCEG